MNRKALLRLFSDSGEPRILDHVPIRGRVTDRHDAALRAAAQRHGKPFKCAARNLPREIIRPIGPGEIFMTPPDSDVKRLDAPLRLRIVS